MKQSIYVATLLGRELKRIFKKKTHEQILAFSLLFPPLLLLSFPQFSPSHFGNGLMILSAPLFHPPPTSIPSSASTADTS